MHLHFDESVFWNDLQDLVDAVKTGISGHDQHKAHAKRLRDPASSERRIAKFQIAANCLSCGQTLVCDVKSIWERGSPVSVALVDEKCPRCKGTKGYNYHSTKGLHA